MEYPSARDRDDKFQALVTLLHSVPKENFDPFDILNTSYHSCGYDIGVDIIVPKRRATRVPRPLMVRIHGGFLITGSSLFPAWFSKWVLDYAELNSAVIISPDYRLLPEAKGVDILRDMSEFWKWLIANGPTSCLAEAGRKDVTIDFDQLLLVGESAGGYLAIQSVLSGFINPRAMICLYPMLDMKSDYYTKECKKPIVSVPNYTHDVVDSFLNEASKRGPITSADPPERLQAALASVQTGRFLEFLGNDPELFVLERMQSCGNDSQGHNQPLLPPLLLLHGEEDSAVPVEGTHRFLGVLQQVSPSANHRLVTQKGDHGFDVFATLDDAWLRQGLEWVDKFWLTDREERNCRL